MRGVEWVKGTNGVQDGEMGTIRFSQGSEYRNEFTNRKIGPDTARQSSCPGKQRVGERGGA